MPSCSYMSSPSQVPTGQYKSYPSPSPQTLHSTNVLSLDQIEDHRKAVLDIQSDISSVNSEITRTVLHLTSEHQRLNNSLVLYQALVAPIRRLPTEIISEIFRSVPRSLREPFRKSNSPILLTQICSRWRAIAISTPQLWDIIAFTAFRAVPDGKSFPIAMWETWLSRSGTCPLTIKVRFEPTQTQSSIDSHRPIIDMLTSCSRRWHSFDIVAPFSLDHFAAVKGSLPILTSLTIDSTYQTQLDAFQGAPNLRKLHIMSPSVVPTQCRVSRVRLRLLRAPATSINECLATLIHFPNLSWCNLHHDGTRTMEINIPATPIKRDKLQVLRIHTNNNDLCSYIFQSFTCPALYSLHIQSTESHVALDMSQKNHLPSFLTRSSCVLRSLSLHHVSLNHPGLVECLEELPALTKLHLREAYSQSPPSQCPLFDRMTYKNQLTVGAQSAVLVPNLKVLTLNMRFSLRKTVLPMIQSRWHLPEVTPTMQGATRLNSVRLTLRGAESITDVDAIHSAGVGTWRDEGLDIQVIVDGTRRV